ncbi:MAG: response regulator [Bacteroidales bacterium]|jgi:response regulator RpfG family c-di-GMP phosphodiesterase|nr:response regulator [Bacteroidales bacterium]
MDNILIVDDHPENIQLIAEIINASFPNIRLFQAIRVDIAKELCTQTKFDLIISDWEMPEKTGIDLIRSLKEDQTTRQIPVIIVTAIMLTAENLNIALSAGAHDYLRSPVDPLELTARVSAALKLSRLHLQEIKEKDRQLMEKTLIHVKNNEFNRDLIKHLQPLLEICKDNPEAKEIAENSIASIEQKIKEDSWKSFEVAFQNIHGDFTKNLLLKHPNITKSELRLCTLLKLDMNTKDIASMLYLSPESLKVSRSRLRARLGMTEEDSFHNCLSKF